MLIALPEQSLAAPICKCIQDLQKYYLHVKESEHQVWRGLNWIPVCCYCCCDSVYCHCWGWPPPHSSFKFEFNGNIWGIFGKKKSPCKYQFECLHTKVHNINELFTAMYVLHTAENIPGYCIPIRGGGVTLIVVMRDNQCTCTWVFLLSG